MTISGHLREEPTPKVVGADIELGNSWTGGRRARGNLDAASKILESLDRLACFGPARCDGAGASLYGEWGRRWLKNGGCVYIDMSHVEICPPETTSARRHAAAVHAMLHIVRVCRKHAQRQLDDGEELFVNAHNSDGSRETSWGGHLDLLITRTLWDALFEHKPHQTALAASFIAAMAPIFGQGFLLPHGGSCRYVLSTRAHHVTKIATLATTVPYGRSLLNTRDESHARNNQARLHLIVFDTCLQPAAIFLRTGLTQLFFAALEAGGYAPALLLDDPVGALAAWSGSFDPAADTLIPTTVKRAGARPINLVTWHRRLIAFLAAFVPRRIPESIVPEGQTILDLWSDTLDAVEGCDWDVLARRLDWALKWRMLRDHPACPENLHEPALRLLDQYYGHVDEREGLFWPCWRSGLVERLFDDGEVRQLLFAGDRSTRSALRGAIVGRFGAFVRDIDWGSITLTERQQTWWPPARRWVIDMPDPADPGPIASFDGNSESPTGAALFDLLERWRQPAFASSARTTYFPTAPYSAAGSEPLDPVDDGNRTKGTSLCQWRKEDQP